MAYNRGVARDEAGNAIGGASVSVFQEGTTTEATIYSDPALTTTISNPITTDASGVYEFWIVAGIYDIQIAATGFTTVTLTDITIGILYGEAYKHEDGFGEALNASTYTAFSSDSWTSGLIAGGAFSHLDGAITYLADATAVCEVNFSGVLDSDANVNVNLAVGVDGVYDTNKAQTSIPTLSATDRTIMLSQLVTLDKDEVVTIGGIAASGTPTIIMQKGTVLTVKVLA